ncbi:MULTISPECIES: GNAT family N-acetyltransferase [unclassified Paracoccus (in: a-proteobacteria)]|uniref:GNAT family N-acetyltransferase n=1 Tax=unclassified Paracoccus (in: a-proteobacteria) TaxID=2688777 RepID=UPI0012B1F69E|nr:MULTISPECIES: GNAT family N-acetyltransferase [unclassified Paracoccus (in: a-proteobacteria)]UXU75123.1 GNAT family N-acetyltransferase [Paracoccus sp. SMMA_5]UXU81026.1 GNAT family N-acetyltransferase [Paracoccus sp. SMMA_5_TC]
MIQLRSLTGEDVAAVLDDLARLRIAVFRDWPYLYDGDADYERDYLQAYLAPGAVVVAAYDGARMIGAATGAPMEDHAQDFAAAFAGRPERLDQIYYCAESVLLPEYRGRGLGHAFFDGREAQARLLGRRYSAFCSVIRPADHPLCPPNYRPLDGFWRKRGYQPLPGVIASYEWRDIGAAAPTRKPLQFWIKPL